jgi:hypothetical protein
MNCLRRNVLLLMFLACLGLAGQAQDEPRQPHVGRVLDWSYHHVTVSGGLTDDNLDAARSEPRILFHLAERNLVRTGDDAVPVSSGSARPRERACGPAPRPPPQKG